MASLLLISLVPLLLYVADSLRANVQGKMSDMLTDGLCCRYLYLVSILAGNMQSTSVEPRALASSIFCVFQQEVLVIPAPPVVLI